MAPTDEEIIAACGAEGLAYRSLAERCGLPIWPLWDETRGRKRLDGLVAAGRLKRGRRREQRNLHGHKHAQLVYFWRTP
jgi:hypothetical protein